MSIFEQYVRSLAWLWTTFSVHFYRVEARLFYRRGIKIQKKERRGGGVMRGIRSQFNKHVYHAQRTKEKTVTIVVFTKTWSVLKRIIFVQLWSRQRPQWSNSSDKLNGTLRKVIWVRRPTKWRDDDVVT